MICSHEEEITYGNFDNGNVLIDPSTNADRIRDIVIGSKVFKFSRLDENPSLNITFRNTRIPLRMNLANATNVAHYNITIIYTDGMFDVLTVSKQVFTFQLL